MKQKKIPVLLWLVVPIIAALLMGTGPAEAAPFASRSWKVVPTPNHSTSSSALIDQASSKIALRALNLGEAFYTENIKPAP